MGKDHCNISILTTTFTSILKVTDHLYATSPLCVSPCHSSSLVSRGARLRHELSLAVGHYQCVSPPKLAIVPMNI